MLKWIVLILAAVFFFLILFPPDYLIHKKTIREQEEEAKLAADTASVKYTGLKLSINLLRNNFRDTDDIMIEVTLTNIADTDQNILFDTSESYGPYHVSLLDMKSKKSALKYSSWAFMSSSVYIVEEWQERMKPYYKIIKPGHSIIKQYNLYSVAVINDNKLPMGTYLMQLVFGNIQSNALIFTVR